MSDPTEEFDDPALKSAIRGALGKESAPPGMHARVLAATGQVPGSGSIYIRSRRFALAAMVVVGLGIGAFFLFQKSEPPVPDWFADAMITQHDTLKTVADHQPIPGVQQNDFPAMRKALREILGHPALVTMLGDGWTYTGAGVCEINRVPAAHLMFAKDDQTLSIFSISANLLYSGLSSDGSNYSQSRNGYELAGFVYHGGIHCLVLKSPTKKTGLRQVMAMRDRARQAPEVFPQERPPLQIRPDPFR